MAGEEKAKTAEYRSNLKRQLGLHYASLEDHMMSIKESIGEIRATGTATYEQACKTNGRVNKHDEYLKAHGELLSALAEKIQGIKIEEEKCPMRTGMYDKDLKYVKVLNTCFGTLRSTAFTLVGVIISVKLIDKIDLKSVWDIIKNWSL